MKSDRGVCVRTMKDLQAGFRVGDLNVKIMSNYTLFAHGESYSYSESGYEAAEADFLGCYTCVVYEFA